MPCEGPCKTVFVDGNTASIQITSVRRYQLYIDTWQEVPGTSVALGPGALDPQLKNELKRYLARFVEVRENCDLGCYCDYERISTREEHREQVLLTRSETLKTEAFINYAGSTPQQTADRVQNGDETAVDPAGRPVQVDPRLDEVRIWCATACGPTFMLDLHIYNHFETEITCELDVVVTTEEGRCKDLPAFRGKELV